MKSGTGDDPFADSVQEDEVPAEHDESTADADASDSEAASETTAQSASDTAVTATQTGDSTVETETDNGHTSADGDDTESTAAAAESQQTGSSGTEKPDDSHIPWVLRRSSVKDNRPNITQFFLRNETDRGERALRSDVEQILDKDVYTLDLREAAYLVAMEHPEEVAETLRDWGYDYLD